MNHLEGIKSRLPEGSAMLLTSEANCFYATGFAGEGAVVLSSKGVTYITDSRYTEAAEKVIGGADVAQMSREHPFSACVKAALEGSGASEILIEEDNMTVSTFAQYEKKLPLPLQSGASEILRELRSRKDARELESLVAAQRIAERALEKILGDIRPGVTEKEIAARLQYYMLSGGAEKMSFDPIVASGANGSMPHAVPTDKTIAPGEFVTMDFGCIYHGYCSDMTRTVCVGEPTEEMRRVYDTVLQAQLAGIAAAKAGVTGAAVDGAARKVIADAHYGACFGHSFGHGVGVEIHEAPNAAPGNDKPLPVGAVISAEPGIYLPGRFGVRIEDVLVLRENGCEDITRADKKLLIL